MSEIPHKPLRFPGRPKGSVSRKKRITVPILGGDPIEYRINVIRAAGQQCVELLRCVAGVCETIHRRCEQAPHTEGGSDANG